MPVAMNDTIRDWIVPLIDVREILFAILSLIFVVYSLSRGRRKFIHIVTVLSTFAALATFFQGNATPIYVTVAMLAIGKAMTLAKFAHRALDLINLALLSLFDPHIHAEETESSAPIEPLSSVERLRKEGNTRKALRTVKDIIGANLPELEVFEARMTLAAIYAVDIGSLPKARRVIDEACAMHGIHDGHRDSARERMLAWVEANERAPEPRPSLVARQVPVARSFVCDFESLVNNGRFGSAVDCAEEHLEKFPEDLAARVALALLYANRKHSNVKLAGHVQRIIDHEPLPEELRPRLAELAALCESEPASSLFGAGLSRRLAQPRRQPDPPLPPG